ncbi:MAG: DEAD/DEAH box helicase family protein [Candidatus Nanopelagicales bacterium]|nr:DEAD/DEAH box helicase family protein [Candidatus Nanopelagicales bacterium]
MEFKFDAHQQYQQDAVAAVVDLFDGQPADASALEATLHGVVPDSGDQLSAFEIASEVGAVGNNLLLDDEAILQNLQVVQDRNGLEVVGELAGGALDFDIEMETGTGKTYVYLRTIFELAKRYNFTKFVILVPSVAVKEGVTTSIKLMTKHFQDLYATPFDATVYSGSSAEEVQPFATSTSVQIMVMTIDSLRGDKNTRVIHQTRDKLNGLRPIDYLRATHPVVIMDEPQNMESLLSQSAVGELSPLCTLRYSATHRKTRNVVYRLDPVDAHDLGLVKQIVVAEALQHGADAGQYIKLASVKNDKGFAARMELACRKESDGSIERKTVSIKNGQDLAVVTGNAAYEGWRVNELTIEPEAVEIFPYGWLQAGETIGGSNHAIYREMIRETIREHFRKESRLREQGIKVLSLFFVDKVASFLGEGYNNDTADGPFVQWFDEIMNEERTKNPMWGELLPGDAVDYRRAYFASIKGKKGAPDTYTDTSGASKTDDDAYDLIMRDKARLLDQNEPVRFIFSHSALREGWDNPNVFQICALREMGEAAERRQTIGRGLRLPVNQSGERVPDQGIAQLTVVANESYREFADSLQKEYTASGVSIGLVRPGEFAKIIVTSTAEDGLEKLLGFNNSKLIWDELLAKGMVDKEGRVTANYRPETLGFTLGLSLPTPSDFFWPQEDEIRVVLDKCKIERFVKQQRKRRTRTLNKEIYTTPEFEDFWRTIAQRTTYRVALNRDEVIDSAVNRIKIEQPIPPLRVQVTRAGVKLVRGGTKTNETASRSAELSGAYQLPDIIGELQETTSLTRKTLVDVLTRSGKLGEFIGNPNDFIAMVKRNLQNVLAAAVVEGLQYEKIGGYVYELRELQKDGLEERDLFVDRLYEVQNKQKTDFDYIQIDSDGADAPERQFAELLDSREDVKLFMKLPDKFKIDTPVGNYNPDWAIIKQVDGKDRIYIIRETKSTLDESKRRPTENAKIKAAAKHFEAIGIGAEAVDYAVGVPGNWDL